MLTENDLLYRIMNFNIVLRNSILCKALDRKDPLYILIAALRSKYI